MANLVETAEWVDGIYQFETTDPLEGGPDGLDNIQAIQLAKRTQFLKALILAAQNSLAGHEAAADPHPQYLTTAEGNSLIATAVSALVNSSPATLDTLNELAAALGNDPNFATTIATALGNKQPIDQTLTALAALDTAANKLIYATGPDTFALADLTAFARSLLDDADAATMRSTIGAYGISEVKTLFSATDSAPVFACRAWVNFNGTGTVAIRASGNVSSITDNGAGNYNVNFTTAMPDANYVMVAGGGEVNNSSLFSGNTATRVTQAGVLATTSAQHFTGYQYVGGGSALQDVAYCYLAFFR